MEFSNPIYKMNFFSSKTHISTPFVQDLRNESDFSENEIPDLNSLKPFEFEPKTNTGDVNSSSSIDEEEGAGYKVKRISNSEWC